MPIRHAIWAVGTTPAPLALGRLASEQQLDEMIVADPAILSPEWMLIGRQEITPFAGRIDLLAIAPDASLGLIELKRDKVNLDIFWLKDEALEESANLPPPAVIAADIVEDLEAALEQFRELEEELKV